jgi:3-hexulose-6-phosphate synthase
MKLQIALDRLTKNECLKIIEEIKDVIDIVEIGTGVIKEYGMEFIREIKRMYPDLPLLADMKTCDAGIAETLQALEAGADYTTVMAFSSDETIAASLEAASLYGKKVVIDLLGVKDPMQVERLSSLGATCLSLHIGKDTQTGKPDFQSLFKLLPQEHFFETWVAGGLDMDTLGAVATENPDIAIVGSAITKAISPRTAALALKELIQPQ